MSAAKHDKPGIYFIPTGVGSNGYVGRGVAVRTAAKRHFQESQQNNQPVNKWLFDNGVKAVEGLTFYVLREFKGPVKASTLQKWEDHYVEVLDTQKPHGFNHQKVSLTHTYKSDEQLTPEERYQRHLKAVRRYTADKRLCPEWLEKKRAACRRSKAKKRSTPEGREHLMAMCRKSTQKMRSTPEGRERLRMNKLRYNAKLVLKGLNMDKHPRKLVLKHEEIWAKEVVDGKTKLTWRKWQRANTISPTAAK